MNSNYLQQKLDFKIKENDSEKEADLTPKCI